MLKRSKSLIILIISVIVVIVIGVAVILLLPDEKKTDALTEKLSTGQELFDEGDYESAIKYFEDAIELDPDSESAYRTLGMCYIRMDRPEDARTVWLKGYEETGSEKLLKLVDIYIDKGNTGAGDSGSEDPDKRGDDGGNGQAVKGSESVAIANSVFTEFDSYKYSDYVTHYGLATVVPGANGSAVTHSRFNGRFVYSTEPSGKSKLGDDGDPLPDTVPDSISVNDIGMLFEGFDGSITYSQLEKLGLIGLRKESAGYVTFKYKGSVVTIQSDENGNIVSADASNTIIPTQYSSGDDEVTKRFTIDIVMATTGAHITSDYTVQIAKKEDVRSGEDSPLNSGDGVFFNSSISNGVFEVELANGEYVVCLAPDDAPDRFRRYNWVIDDTTTDVDLKLIVADNIATGQILIVLKWGDTPRDLDSHLVGEGDHISFMNTTGQHAWLDVDCINGNGIETITINDPNGTYTYYVDNYSEEAPTSISGATVEVFSSGGGAAQTFTVPDGITDIWEVFTISNGVITPANTEAPYIR